MDTYTLLLMNNGYKTQNSAYIVYYSPAGGDLHHGFPFEVEVHELDIDPESVNRLFIEAKECLLKPIPVSNSGCEYCNWLNHASRF